MKRTLPFLFLLFSFPGNSQEWSICATPAFENRVDDIFMVTNQVGYAVCGDGRIVKSTNGGENWYQVARDTAIYCRSVEFVNEQKGFVGGFPSSVSTTKILRRTLDGGSTWTDLTSLLHPTARQGICGLAAADENTIYGCGNWYGDSAYLVKSTDGGDSWSFIDMGAYATSLIDMHFTGADTGFVTGKGPLPDRRAVIYYTTDGGLTWDQKFESASTYEYCWKIQHLNDSVYFASIEDFSASVTPKIVKSNDGGMTWTPHVLSTVNNYNVEGVGFIDSLHGWAGGDFEYSFESFNGGLSWSMTNVCPSMNRVFRVSDSLLFATGSGIWKYGYSNAGLKTLGDEIKYAAMNCSPNLVSDALTIDVDLQKYTHLWLAVFDINGRIVEQVENLDKKPGKWKYKLDAKKWEPGTYFVALKTHEDKIVSKIVLLSH